MEVTKQGSQTVHPHGLNQEPRANPHVPSSRELSPKEEKQVQELKKTDREVRAHEQAHKAAAGKYATGGPSYEYETGPDGKQYAVGGEVQIDTSEVKGDPEASIRKAQVIRAAALAPHDPSAQDRRVAAEANRMEAEARQELAEQKAERHQAYSQSGVKRGLKHQPAIVDVFI